MIIRQLFDHATYTYTYLLGDEQSGTGVLIDPVAEHVDRDLSQLDEMGLKLEYILDTHVHADHITGSGILRERTGARTGISAAAGVACVDMNLAHGETLEFSDFTIETRHTPGHTDGCATYVVRNGTQTYAFTGDALLIRGCGRTDFQQGDPKRLYSSIHEQVFTLSPETIIYPGHDYKGRTQSTVAEEKKFNPRLNVGVDEATFVEVMRNLNLAEPKRIQEAVPANLGCGLRTSPVEESAGVKNLLAGAFSSWDKGRIIDVRFPMEFEGPLGHLEEAELFPLPTLRQAVETWDKETPLLVVCQSGNRSMVACQLLHSRGFKSVTNLDGGMLGLRQGERRKAS